MNKERHNARRRQWRKQRLAETPPKGQKICVHCLVFKPLEHFNYNYGQRAMCYRCYQVKCQSREKRTKWRRQVWRADPEHRAGVMKRHNSFKSKKPFIMKFYKWRQYVDDVLNYGPKWAKKVLLEEYGVVYDLSCRICNSQEELFVHWPDYSKPHVIHRYCPYHRKIEQFADNRTLKQQIAEAAKGDGVINEIRGRLRRDGLGYGELQESLNGKRGKKK